MNIIRSLLCTRKGDIEEKRKEFRTRRLLRQRGSPEEAKKPVRTPGFLDSVVVVAAVARLIFVAGYPRRRSFARYSEQAVGVIHPAAFLSLD